MKTVLTDRLELTPLSRADETVTHEIYSDPQTWAHLLELRHKTLQQTRAMIESAAAKWQKYGASYWAVRLAVPVGELPAGTFIGNGGINPLEDAAAGLWNLGYRLTPASWGHGLATELASAALKFAAEIRPEHPVTGRTLENNPGSYSVLEKIGLTLQWSGAEAPGSVSRLIYADRPLNQQQLQALIDLG